MATRRNHDEFDMTSPLPQRPLGPNGPSVGAVGFGAMALSIAGRPSESDAVRVIHAALDAGLTLIDTADVYCLDDSETGHNERLIGKALRSWGASGDGIVVATKGGYTRPGGRLVPNGHPAHLKRACEQSLRSLGRDVIELYQLHTPDRSIPFVESIGALSRLRDEGKLRWVGLSNVGVALIKEAQRIVPIQTVQNELSVFRRDSIRVGPVARFERLGIPNVRRLRHFIGEPFNSGVVAHCEQAGLGFLAYSPLGGLRNVELTQANVLQSIGRNHGVSTHAVAVAWTLAQSSSVLPIPSARTVEHLQDSLHAVDLDLAPRELAAIDTESFRTARR